MEKLQKAGGLAAIGEALIYIGVFAFYGAAWEFPKEGTVQKMAYLAQHQFSLALVNLVGYVLSGVLLAVLVLALHERLKAKAPALASLASIFGLVWVGLVIASGMIGNIGLGAVVKAASDDPERARLLWQMVTVVVEGLGGGNEVVGGLWVLLLSCAALKGETLPRALNGLGLLVGVAGIATVYPSGTLTEIFGLSQIVWFAWLGIYLASRGGRTVQLAPPSAMRA